MIDPRTFWWLLAAVLVLALFSWWLGLYLTKPRKEEEAPLAPTATDNYVREMREARRAKALKAAQRSLDEGAARG